MSDQSIPPPPPPGFPQSSPVPPDAGFTCPFCRHQGLPIRNKKVSSSGWIVFVLLILFCIPLCWLPFVIDGLQEEERKCARCGARLG